MSGAGRRKCPSDCTEAPRWEVLGPGRSLSSRLREVLSGLRPDLFPEGALVFPNESGGFIDPRNFRSRVFDRVVRRAFGRRGRATPHRLRHTFASLHMARGTNLKWIQEQGGWSSAKLLLDWYGHFMPTETKGYADALSTDPDGPIRPQGGEAANLRLRGNAKRRPPTRVPFPREG